MNPRKKEILKSVEFMLGLIPKTDLEKLLPPQFDDKFGMVLEMVKMAPYNLKMAFLKFMERSIDLAEKKHGPEFTHQHIEEAMMDLLNGNPMNMLSLLSSAIIQN